MKSYTIKLEEDENGDLILPFTDELLNEVGWKEGDTLGWKDNKDGSFTLSKQEENEWVLVECISTFRERYMVEVPKGKSEWAMDTVVMNEAKEFSQEHLGETIVSHRVVTKEEALTMCDVDNDYCSSWSEEKKLDAFFTKVEDNNESD